MFRRAATGKEGEEEEEEGEEEDWGDLTGEDTPESNKAAGELIDIISLLLSTPPITAPLPPPQERPPLGPAKAREWKEEEECGDGGRPSSSSTKLSWGLDGVTSAEVEEEGEEAAEEE